MCNKKFVRNIATPVSKELSLSAAIPAPGTDQDVLDLKIVVFARTNDGVVARAVLRVQFRLAVSELQDL